MSYIFSNTLYANLFGTHCVEALISQSRVETPKEQNLTVKNDKLEKLVSGEKNRGKISGEKVIG